MAIQALAEVELPDPETRMSQYPHQLSGGMRQRVMIAMALMLDPDILIADEPTTALDVTVQAQILDRLLGQQRRRGMSMLLITHDLGVVAAVADRVAVMYSGEIVEQAPVAQLFADPQHPYTQGLLRAVPQTRHQRGALHTIPGRVPPPQFVPPGCPFSPRCSQALVRCWEEHPRTGPRRREASALFQSPAPDSGVSETPVPGRGGGVRGREAARAGVAGRRTPGDIRARLRGGSRPVGPAHRRTRRLRIPGDQPGTVRARPFRRRARPGVGRPRHRGDGCPGLAPLGTPGAGHVR